MQGRSICILLVIAAAGACYPSQIDRASYRVPQQVNAVIVIERRPGHAFFAEYNRRVELNLETRKLAQADLYFDSGGYSRVNLYRISDSAFLIRDCFESFVVDTARQTIERDDTRRKEGAFVGSFDVDSSGAWRFISARERAELPTELKGG